MHDVEEEEKKTKEKRLSMTETEKTDKTMIKKTVGDKTEGTGKGRDRKNEYPESR